jgi:hypothetical protein
VIFNDISLFGTRKNEIALIICAGGIDERFHIIVVSLFNLYWKAQTKCDLKEKKQISAHNNFEEV